MNFYFDCSESIETSRGGLECSCVEYFFVISLDNEILPHIEPSLALLNLTSLI